MAKKNFCANFAQLRKKLQDDVTSRTTTEKGKVLHRGDAVYG